MVVTNVRDLTELYSLREEVEKTKLEGMRLKRELSHMYERFSIGDQIVDGGPQFPAGLCHGG